MDDFGSEIAPFSFGPNITHGPAEIEKAEAFVSGVAEPEPLSHFVRVDKRRGAPKGGHAQCGGSEVHVVDSTGDGLDLFNLGDFLDCLAFHGDGNDDRGLEGQGGELVEFILSKILFGSDPAVEGLAEFGEALTPFVRENEEAPWFRHAMGGSPIGIFENANKVSRFDHLIGHVLWFDGATAADQGIRGREAQGHRVKGRGRCVGAHGGGRGKLQGLLGLHFETIFVNWNRVTHFIDGVGVEVAPDIFMHKRAVGIFARRFARGD